MILRSFQPDNLPALVAFWNQEFVQQRNFHPITEVAFQRRVLDAPATDPAGLILAWDETRGKSPHLVGLVHAFRPPPDTGLYRNWTPNHTIALLYVAPPFRRQGIGSRLLTAAESWLYYCPVHFAGHAQPVYGSIEGPRPPLFGSSERMGVEMQNAVLIDFLAKRGYLSVDVGDVSLIRTGNDFPPLPTFPPEAAGRGLRPILFGPHQPFDGTEATRLPTVTQWGHNEGYQYKGVGVVDGENILRGHLAWYPMPVDGKIALVNFRVEPDSRRLGLGSYLLDWGLREMSSGGHPSGEPVRAIELHTHLIRSADAVRLYARRGFEVTTAWVNLVKT